VQLYTDPDYRECERRAVARQIARREWPVILEACLEYCEICRRVPGHKTPAPDPKSGRVFRPAGAPFGWVLVNYLAAGNPDRIEAAWNTPYAVACCMFDAGRDIEGKDDTLESVEESQRFDAYLEREAKRKAGGA
jgi:hypothetical protein